MVRGIEGNEMSTPRPSAPKKTATRTPSQSNAKAQSTLLGFFQKKDGSQAQSSATSKSSPVPSPIVKRESVPSYGTSDLTPAPSSDAVDAPSPDQSEQANPSLRGSRYSGLPSPISPTNGIAADASANTATVRAGSGTPSRRVKKHVKYAESDEDSDSNGETPFKPLSNNATNRRVSKKRKVILDESDDEFGLDAATEAALVEEDMDDFIVPDNSDDEMPTIRKRKRLSAKSASKVSSPRSMSTPLLQKVPTEDQEIPTESTARQWTYDPENTELINTHPTRVTSDPSKNKRKQKAHMSEPDQRYPWLADIRDIEQHAPDHADYDPRTLYIPPLAWIKFSPFEKQYWEIKQKYWNTIVFFKKGKFYELYENDATIGHQLFNLKLTDRVNMRMVGVPEASLDQWASQFVAKGYKIARVDQMESALAKEMRERDDGAPKKSQKEDKVIRRELAQVLTAGTLVEGGMLQGDMATFCVAIKEIEKDNLPTFGIAFVDTATAQFHLAEFEDDADMTKFETFVAQTRPSELLLEKSCLSSRALRILKSNTSQTTIWNWLKPTKEFWTADIASREIDATGYFVEEESQVSDVWPITLREACNKEVVMSAFGALLQYLRTLKIDRELVSLGNFKWYDPIQKAETLILDGQSLINLEIFANSFDGGNEGTLFAMLNRCVTPFGKRLLRQWVCHPLGDARKINERLDAVDALNADMTIQDRFTASLTKLPDLERLISRVHAGRCKGQDFCKVIDGFEQIDYTMSLVRSFGEGDGLVGQLIARMPDLESALKPWKSAFSRSTARENGILVPERGVELDYDESSDNIKQCEADLQTLLNRARKDLGSSSIQFRDIGKEIYQLEVPVKVKSVPKNWDQVSATAQVKRWYSPELRKLVRTLQELRETHAQIIKEVAGRFFARFDEDYTVWLEAVNIIANLDCLISLSRASSSLGSPSCRPQFVDSKRSVLDFVELRHPTMLTTVSDFIPNDIRLGGSAPKINLLTGANAAGKSTVLRMTCIAVILAQLGCHIPCSSAILTPVDRIMSRLGANDNILQQQSTFFVELAETKKILSEATPRSLVILDELGRGTSSVDGLAVAEAVLHHVAGSVGCSGFFATHYHALAHTFAHHPEIAPKRMQIAVDDKERRVTFLYRLESGVAEGSFGMHCASMCGIPSTVVDRAEEAAGMWEHSGRVREKIEMARGQGAINLGWLSDIAWILKEPQEGEAGEAVNERALDVLARAIDVL